MRTYQLSCAWATVRVTVDARDRIRATAPLLRRFVGQPRFALLQWLCRKSQGAVTTTRLD